MAGVAINGSLITEIIKPNHVSYDVYYWQQTGGGYCAEYNPDPPYECIDYESPTYGWVFSHTASTGAKIVGTVVVPSSKLKISGNNIAKVGDRTDEIWEASPPVPTSSISTDIRNISPGISGSGQGEIISGSSKMRLLGQPVALIGSRVKTCLDIETTINNGNTKINSSS